MHSLDQLEARVMLAGAYPAPITIDGDFSDWAAAPNFTDPVDDQHDTDHDQAGDTPAYVDHPDVDLLNYRVSHDEENFYFYFEARGQIGRTQMENAAEGLRAGRYYVIVTIDVDNDDSTGYPLYEGGYYTGTTDTTGYDANGELEFFNGEFNTGHYLQHGARDDTELEQAFADQSNNGYIWGGPDTQGPFEPGFVNVLPGTYAHYTQWVYKENDPNFGGNDSVTFVKDRGPIVIGNITYALSPDGRQLEMKVPFKGFLKDADGNPIVAIGKKVDLSFSLEASGELSNEVSPENPDGFWASDTGEPIIGYYLSPPPSPVIVDDGDTGHTSTGGWGPSPLAGGHDNDSQVVSSGDGSEISTWTFSGLLPGDYHVSATWLAHVSHATNASFKLYDGPGGALLATVSVNQQLAPNDFSASGSDWERLSTVSITGTELVVELTNAADSAVNADAILIQSASPASPSNALSAYVSAFDPSYGYTVDSTFTGDGYTAYVLDMTSQTWRDSGDVDLPVWKHWVTVYVPDTVVSNTAVLFVDGGRNTQPAPTSGDEEAVLFATATGMVTVHLRMVPSEPLIFTDEGFPRTEDEIIAYTYDKYLRTGDQSWPLLLAMVKSAVAAMNTAQDFDDTLPGVEINDFMVTGASKRGWTTWLTAAFDPRVKSIAPLVFDVLNMKPSMENHREQYIGVTDEIIGGYAAAVHDYTDIGIFDRFDTYGSEQLRAIIDPYEYREFLTLPKYLVHSAGDEFFVPTSSQFYFQDLQGPSYQRYVPNTGHSLNVDALQKAANFMRAIDMGLTLPELDWVIQNKGRTIRATTPDTPVSVKLWQATNRTELDFRNSTFGQGPGDEWTSTDLTGIAGTYVGTIAPPASGGTMFFLEFTYIVGGLELVFTTDVSLVTPQSITTDVIYVNDDFTAENGTIIADADPNTPGDQGAIIGLNAFATIAAGLDAVDTGGTVYITDDLQSDGLAVYTENLVITRSVTIASTESSVGAVVIDGAGGERVITFQSVPSYLVLSNLVIQNGREVQGGGILNMGTLTIHNSVVQDNVATGSGGGIWNSGTVYVNGSEILGNSADSNGGGIFNSNAPARVYVDNSLVDGNMAGEEGGGLWNAAGGLMIVRNGSIVSDNSASGEASDQGGGGIFNNGGRLAISSGVTISENRADGEAGRGGGIFSVNGVVTIDNSTVSGNSSSGAGGGIEIVTGTVNLTNTQLDENIAGALIPGAGGGLNISGVGAKVTIAGGTVSRNSATTSGGGLVNRNGNTLIVRDGTVIDGNWALGDGANDGGGGLFNEAGRLAIESGVTLSNNKAIGTDGSGGGLLVANGSVTIYNSFITENTANRAGGGIEFVTGYLELRNTHLDMNIAGPDGAANPGNGGGLHVTGRQGQVGKVYIYGGTVSGNTAALEGGGIWNNEPTVMVIRDGTIIDGNMALGDASHDGGGGIFNNGGRLAILNNVQISNNTATGTSASGGGIFVAAGGVTVEGNSVITGNLASRAGGGIEVVWGEVILVDSTLSNNTAGPNGTANPGRGGGLNVTGTNMARVDLRNTVVTGNQAATEGGGLWNESTNVMLVRAGSHVSNNTAAGSGAGIFNNGGRLMLNGATIDGNTSTGASSSGGGLYHVNGVVTIENTTLSNNSAPATGGGIAMAGGQLWAVNMTLSSNDANSGGGLHVSGSPGTYVSILGGRVSSNISSADGGGIWHQASSILLLHGGATIYGNMATGHGGGLFNNGGRVAITDASIWGNTAGENGGGVSSTGGAITLDNSTVSGNAAKGNGGGILSNGELITANATIANNRSNSDGVGGGAGGGLFNGGLVTLKNTIVAGNLVGTGTSLSDIAGNNVRMTSVYNLIGDASSAGGLVHGMNGNIVGDGQGGFLTLSSILSPLTNNGGPTLTHALVTGSPALNAGLNSAAVDIYGRPFIRDQRGFGFARIKSTTVDIGAFEL